MRKAFDAVADGIQKAAEQLNPGVKGWEIYAVASQQIVESGYPEYQNALGHQVGKEDHDGGTILGPRWPRYGQTPFCRVEAGNVFTLEPSITAVGDSGCLGLEEMVLVTDTGCQWLSEPQRTLPCLGREA